MSISFWVGDANRAREQSTGRCLYKGFAPPASSATRIHREKTTQTPQSKGLPADSLGPVILSLKPLPTMPQSSTAVRTIEPSDWVATYFISVATLAVVLTLLVNLIVQLSSRDPWGNLLDALSFSVVILLVCVAVIGAVAALPCILFFWLAQRFTWRHLWIYLLGGALASLPSIPMVVSLSPGFFNLPYGVNILERYWPLAHLFGACGAFLGAMFWWLSGRHLR